MEIILKRALEECRQKVDHLIAENVPHLGTSSTLRDACEYALLNGGKRFRPALVLLVGEALNTDSDLSYAALAIEYFHTASLIADDLPCMDNDSERRSKPSLHVAFGESTALMASYALISAGYSLLAKNAEVLRGDTKSHSLRADTICRLAVENVSVNTGLSGATGGQYLDMYPPDLTLETLWDISQKKTASLFEISFVLGWLYGGGDLDRLPEVKRAAYHFGMAFQIGDDLGDMEQDRQNGRSVNMALTVGEIEAKRLFEKEISLYREELTALGISSPELVALSEGVAW